MNREPQPCHMCQRFRRQANAQPGQGYCSGYERMRRHDETNEACVLWNEAKNRAERRAWAEQQPKEST
jgi:hypothetical protein